MATRRSSHGERQRRLTRGILHYHIVETGKGCHTAAIADLTTESKSHEPVVVSSFIVPEWVLRKVYYHSFSVNSRSCCFFSTGYLNEIWLLSLISLNFVMFRVPSPAHCWNDLYCISKSITCFNILTEIWYLMLLSAHLQLEMITYHCYFENSPPSDPLPKLLEWASLAIPQILLLSFWKSRL